MSSKRSPPEIRATAFSAAREKCAMSVEELAHLACLSKKQIQQIENDGRNAFYSLEIKYVAAKKVAKLIQLDEKEAFDFGPQAELPFAAVVPAEPGASEINNAQENALPKVVPVLPEINQAAAATPEKKAAAPLARTPINQSLSKHTHSAGRNQKSPSKKWFWLLPVGALAVALVQLQPLLEDQLDALMVKPKPVEAVALTAAPVDVAPTSPPAEPASANEAATVQVPPVITPSPAVAVAANPACPVPDASIENYKSPSPSKPGNMVYVKISTAQIVCVEDGDGKVQSKTMEPGIGYSFYGKPPFKLLTSGLSSAEVFFQGFRVRPSNADSKSILLIQVD